MVRSSSNFFCFRSRSMLACVLSTVPSESCVEQAQPIATVDKLRVISTSSNGSSAHSNSCTLPIDSRNLTSEAEGCNQTPVDLPPNPTTLRIDWAAALFQWNWVHSLLLIKITFCWVLRAGHNANVVKVRSPSSGKMASFITVVLLITSSSTSKLLSDGKQMKPILRALPGDEKRVAMNMNRCRHEQPEKGKRRGRLEETHLSRNLPLEVTFREGNFNYGQIFP